MLNLLLFILISYGITNIICNSYIFSYFRGLFLNKKTMLLYNLLTCMMCLSFWIGIILSFWINPINFLFNGFLASGTSWLLNSIGMFNKEQMIDEQRKINLKRWLIKIKLKLKKIKKLK